MADSPEDAAQAAAISQYGREDAQIMNAVGECPECERDSLVELPDGYRCYNDECGGTWSKSEIKRCPNCDAPKSVSEFDDAAMCRNCITQMVAE